MNVQKDKLYNFRQKWQSHYNKSYQVRQVIDLFLSLKTEGIVDAYKQVKDKKFIIPFELIQDMKNIR